MPVKKSERSKAAATSKKSENSKTSTSFSRRFGAGAVVFVAMCVIALVMVMAGREPAQLAAATTADTQPGGDAEVRAKAPVADVAAPSNSEAASATPSAKIAAPVTVAGCLQRNDQTLRLKDTTGADAPKSRSWKSGFLKKGQAKIELVAVPGTNLAGQVGRRVSVTGMLDDREMQVRSVRRLAASCDAK